MILVDSSVWIDHLRAGDPVLSDLLAAQQVLCHPFVVGELSLGSLRQRELILADLRSLPSAVIADDAEVQEMIDRHRLFGCGIGYIDAHLLAATLLTVGARLWTRNGRFNRVAARLGVEATVAG